MENDKILIRHVRIIDPAVKSDEVGDLLISEGEILGAGKLGLEDIPEGCLVIDG